MSAILALALTLGLTGTAPGVDTGRIGNNNIVPVADGDGGSLPGIPGGRAGRSGYAGGAGGYGGGSYEDYYRHHRYEEVDACEEELHAGRWGQDYECVEEDRFYYIRPYEQRRGYDGGSYAGGVGGRGGRPGYGPYGGGGGSGGAGVAGGVGGRGGAGGSSD